MAIDKKITYEDQRLTKAQQKKAKPVNQGGGPNYLGKQETVTVPKKWLSSPDHVVAELAYITPREQKILLDANLYGSLKGKPNKGPGGIMSLQGDLGGYDASPGGPNSGGPSGNRVGETDKNKQRAADIMTGKTNVSSPTGDTVGYGTEPSPFQQAIDFYNKLPTPFNIAKNVLTKLGPLNNKDFYNEKVVPAGKTNLGYEDYMSARMAGTIDAYGNPKDTGQGGKGNQSVLNSGIAGIKGIDMIGEEVIDPTNTASTQDMNFNFGTFSNPIYKKDLV
jgi:hypothetical protein